MQIHSSLFHPFRLLAITAAMVLPGCSSDSHPASTGMHADVAFFCRWWSETQMEGLNPNAPPPKNTEVKLTKWEYSDPVGVPHPDVVDAVVTLKAATGEAMSRLRVEVARQWKEGSRSNAAKAVWGPATVIKKLEDVNVPRAGAYTIRVPVDLKSPMDALEKKGNWPYSLRVNVKVFSSEAQQPLLAKATGELPIHPGD